MAHTLDHARAAVAAAAERGVSTILLSPPGAAAYLGAGYFMAMVAQARESHPNVPVTAVLDCADEPGHALAALRGGVDAIVFTGPAKVAAKIEDIAQQSGATLWRRRPDALDLLDNADPARACRAWLSNGHV